MLYRELCVRNVYEYNMHESSNVLIKTRNESHSIAEEQPEPRPGAGGHHAARLQTPCMDELASNVPGTALPPFGGHQWRRGGHQWPRGGHRARRRRPVKGRNNRPRRRARPPHASRVAIAAEFHSLAIVRTVAAWPDRRYGAYARAPWRQRWRPRSRSELGAASPARSEGSSAVSSMVTISDLISGTAELYLSSEIRSHLRLVRRDLLLAHARRAVLSTPQQHRRLDQLSLVPSPLLLGAPSECRVGHRSSHRPRRPPRNHRLRNHRLRNHRLCTLLWPRGVESGRNRLRNHRLRNHRLWPRGIESGRRSAAVRGGEEQASDGGDEKRHSAVHEARSLPEQRHEQKVRTVERGGRGQLGRSGRRAPDEGGNQRSSSEVLSSDARDGAYRSSRWWPATLAIASMSGAPSVGASRSWSLATRAVRASRAHHCTLSTAPSWALLVAPCKLPRVAPNTAPRHGACGDAHEDAKQIGLACIEVRALLRCARRPDQCKP